MSRPGLFSLLIFLVAAPACRTPESVRPIRNFAGRSAKVTRVGPAPAIEVFPIITAEPQAVAPVVLDQPASLACLAAANEVRDADFVVDVTGRVTESGKVVDVRIRGVGLDLTRCLEDAISNLILVPGRPGDFALTLTRRPVGAGVGVIIDPGVSKKYE